MGALALALLVKGLGPASPVHDVAGVACGGGVCSVVEEVVVVGTRANARSRVVPHTKRGEEVGMKMMMKMTMKI